MIHTYPLLIPLLDTIARHMIMVFPYEFAYVS
jgi:hypothetical protein